METKEALEKIANLWEAEMKPALDRAEQERAKFGEERAETKDYIDKLTTRMDALEADARRAPKGSDSPVSEAAREVKDAFFSYIRRDVGGLTATERKTLAEWQEQKALVTADDTQAGIFAPPEVTTDIIKNVTEINPIRQVATVRQTSREAVKFPKRTGQFAAVWGGEIDTRQATEGLKFAMDTVPLHELTALVPISNWMLEDSVVDIEAIVNQEIAEQFAVAEGKGFLTGDGIQKPLGIMSDTRIGSIKTGDATKLTADSLFDLVYGVKSAYRPSASLMMSRGTLGYIRKLKNSVNGDYLWTPGLQAGQPGLILDRPYVEVPDMVFPNAGAYTTNDVPVLFGDFRRAYVVVDRLQMQVQRLVELQALNNQILILARKRVGAHLLLPEAMAKLVVSA